MITLIKPLLVNITILLSFTFNANLLFPFQSKNPLSFKQKMIYGLIGAFGALLCMFYPIDTLGKTYFDFRMAAVLIVTLYVGPVSGSLVVITVCLYRYYLGGEFAYIGIIISIAAFLIALLFRKPFLNSKAKLLIGFLAMSCYFFVFVSVLFENVEFLQLKFYVIYIVRFYLTILTLIYVIEKLIKINKQVNEMVYMDKLNMVGQLAASIAHEIRNPLQSVKGFIQFLSKDTNDEQLKKFSPLIIEELDRTNGIITNFLKVAKPEEFQLSNVSLQNVLDDCVQLLRPLAAFSNVEIQYDLKGFYYVLGDEHHLKQAMMNLIKNGIESITDQGIIKIKAYPDLPENIVTVHIEDNGRGMTLDQIQNIGLPFYTTKSKGTGLGSMVSNKIIREMNGTIEYESDLYKGTIVKITLPLIKQKE